MKGCVGRVFYLKKLPVGYFFFEVFSGSVSRALSPSLPQLLILIVGRGLDDCFGVLVVLAGAALSADSSPKGW